MKKNIKKKPILLTILSVIAILLIVLYLFLLWYSRVMNSQLERMQGRLDEYKIELAGYHDYSGYTKLLGVEQMQVQKPNMSWSDYIQQVIEILDDLKNVDTDESQTIILSDFNVSLEEISLKGETSTLKALYYNSPSWNFVSLMDRFEKLDFIENMEIKEYSKNSNWLYEFEIRADVNTRWNK